MKIPDAIDLHRFFAPECDLSFGNCAAADVENRRAVPRTRGKRNIIAKLETGGEVDRELLVAESTQGASRNARYSHERSLNHSAATLSPDRTFILV